YRGQCMTLDEIDLLKENVDSRLSVNTFLSTTKNLEVARMYIGNDHPLVQSCIFEIYLNARTEYNDKPFANISDFTAFNDENEILFSMGTVFRVISVEKNEEEHLWYIKLELINDENLLIDFYRTELAQRKMPITLCTFGIYLNRMG
ncbi:unnamed protein product, partial [Didymodactylos carnosus]